MTDFELYDVSTSCRACGNEYLGKSFLPADGAPRFGLCDTCHAADDALMAQFQRPPKTYAKPKSESKVLDFRRRAAGDD